LTPWLKVSYRPAIDTYTDNQEERIAKQGNNTSDYTKRVNQYTETNHEILATFNNEFSNEISLSGVLGANFRDQNRRRTMNSTLGGIIIEDLYTIANSVDAAIQKEDRVFNLEEQSIFAQASVGIKNQVFVDLTVRNDWSSTLPEENNSFLYPSASVSWVFSELLTTDVLSFGKFRASYAEVGNSTTPYRTSNYYAALNNFGSTPLYSVDRTLNNPDLLPETQQSVELGIDVRFLQDRVGLDLAYYQVSTFDQILPVRTSEASGYNFKFINAGEIENKGVEIALTSTPVQVGDFRWDLNLNWAKNTNTVVSLSEDIDNYQLSSHFFVSINAAEGEPFGTFKGTDFVYHDNGEPIIESNGLYRMSDSNQEVLGGYLPNWNGGIINNFTYKNFRLTTLIDIQDGGEFYSESLAFGRATGLYEETAGLNAKGNPKRDAVADGGGVLYPGVQEDGSANTVYAEAGLWNRAWHYWKNPAATYVLDASYVKLRELTLTYTIPGSVLSGTFIQGISVGFTGRNLAILHRNTVHSDPEANNSANNIQGLTSGDYPSQRQYGFNLRMSF
jgi:outer membrane receptor protein involved in Fe transport